MRAISKRIKNDNLDDKRFVKNNHKSYKKDKRIVNKKIRRTPIEYIEVYDNEHKKEHSEITTAILKECKTRDSKRLKAEKED